MCFAMGWGPGPLASVGRLGKGPGRRPEISARPAECGPGRGLQGPRVAGPDGGASEATAHAPGFLRGAWEPQEVLSRSVGVRGAALAAGQPAPHVCMGQGCLPGRAATAAALRAASASPLR